MMTFGERVALAVAAGLMLLMAAIGFPRAQDVDVCDISVEEMLAASPEVTFSPLSDIEIKALVEAFGPPPFSGWDQVWIASLDDASELEFIDRGCVIGWSTTLPRHELLTLIGRLRT